MPKRKCELFGCEKDADEPYHACSWHHHRCHVALMTRFDELCDAEWRPWILSSMNWRDLPLEVLMHYASVPAAVCSVPEKVIS